MSYDWHKYLQMAEELSKTPVVITVAAETCHRTAISRAYYSAFIQARNLLRDFDGYILPTGSEVHAFVIREFDLDSDARRSRIGQNLILLRRNRNMVDYQDNITELEKLARNSIQIARNIIADLSKISR